jgi:hypothetical protein
MTPGKHKICSKVYVKVRSAACSKGHCIPADTHTHIRHLHIMHQGRTCAQDIKEWQAVTLSLRSTCRNFPLHLEPGGNFLPGDSQGGEEWFVQLCYVYFQRFVLRCRLCERNFSSVFNYFFCQIILHLVHYVYRFCGLMVRVPGYRSRGPGSIPGTTRIPEK